MNNDNNLSLSKEELDLWEKIVEAYARCGSGTADLAIEFADQIVQARRKRKSKKPTKRTMLRM